MLAFIFPTNKCFKALIFLFIISSSQLLAQRIVLLEQFTNSGCSICAANDPTLYSYVQANPNQVVAISYHTSFPYFDSLYLENMQESNIRTNYYNVVAVPYSVVDGNYLSTTTGNLNSNLSGTFGTRAAISPDYRILPLRVELDGNQLQCSFQFQSLTASAVNDSLRAHVVVIEEEVLKSSYAGSPGNNTLTSYDYVMRKMLPDAAGSHLFNRNLNGIDTLNFTWNLQHIKNRNELRIVAFVQNTQSKEVYEAYMSTPTDVTGLEQINSEKGALKVYPNPSSTIIQIEQVKGNAEELLQIYNATGMEVYRSKQKAPYLISVPVDAYPKGIYFLQVTSGNNFLSKKICVE